MDSFKILSVLIFMEKKRFQSTLKLEKKKSLLVNTTLSK